jgi:hypothetical protein
MDTPTMCANGAFASTTSTRAVSGGLRDDPQRRGLEAWRDSPDPFPQRFTGTFSDDGRTITGRWEKAEDGSNWDVDFDGTYRRVS